MRSSTIALLTIAAALQLPVIASGQRAKIHIDDIRVGFPAMAEPGETADERGRLTLHKAGSWVPVYVDLSAGEAGIAGGTLTVESTDSDDIQNDYTVPLPRAGLGPNESLRVMTYTMLGSSGGELTVRVRVEDRNEYRDKKSFDAIGPGDILYLAVGSRLPGLRQALVALNKDAASTDVTRYAYLDDVRMLPTRWFGYGNIDLMLLTTGNRQFVTDLLTERENRKEAIAEWVRRGGKLIISCGRNQDLLPDLLAKLQVTMPVDVRGPLLVDQLQDVVIWSSPAARGLLPLANQASRAQPGAKPPPVELAKLEIRPGADGFELVVPSAMRSDSPLLAVRSSEGMGQVMLIAFDLDGLPFSAWGGQPEFWRKIQLKTRTKPYDSRLPNNSNSSLGYGTYGTDNDVASFLERNLEQFQDVTIISFGWVALFIFIYILIVGPLDYLFLKKVVKRLELTWITFPTVVLLVSALAYFAAYSFKGNDLRINKVDLVDVNMHSGQVYGHTWFTIFSPRIQHYTIAIEPVSPQWVLPPGQAKSPPSVLMSWMGRPEVGYGGFNRARSQSLSRRTYEYGPDAASLHGVPIQVWSTKSFSANWERPYNPAQPPFEVHLKRPQSQDIEGTLTNHLPMAIKDAVLIYTDSPSEFKFKAHQIGRLEPGSAVHVHTLGHSAYKELGNWVTEATAGPPIIHRRMQTIGTPALMRRIMFYDTVLNHDGLRNSVLRYLDQSWRPGHNSELMLVGRVEGLEPRPAEMISEDPRSPSRLWLGGLPDSGTPRPSIPGTMSQETYIRVIIPINRKAP